MIEQSETFTKGYRHEVNLHFVQQASFYQLLGGIYAPYDRDSFVTCDCFCLFTDTFSPVGRNPLSSKVLKLKNFGGDFSCFHKLPAIYSVKRL